MRGTLRASVMVAKAKIASATELECARLEDRKELTHRSNNLRFQSPLTLETSCKVLNTSFAVARDVRYMPDMIEHMSAGK